MSKNDEQNQKPIQEGQTVPKMQFVTPKVTIEKGQPVPSMQQRPQPQPPSHNQGNESTEANE